MKTKLSININKLATLRNSRGKNNPDLILYTKHILKYGVHGITVHPRPDGRHILYEDVFKLKDLLKDYKDIEFNIEGYPNQKFLELIKKIAPHQCTLVPDPPQALTSNAGWDFKSNESLLKKTLHELKNTSTRISLFLDPFSVTDEDWGSLEALSPHRIELYTERYAEAWGTKNQSEVLQKYKQAAEKSQSIGIDVNAGHDLNQKNLHDFLNSIKAKEVSIGHSLICEALMEGFEETIKNYLSQIPS